MIKHTFSESQIAAVKKQAFFLRFKNILLTEEDCVNYLSKFTQQCPPIEPESEFEVTNLLKAMHYAFNYDIDPEIEFFSKIAVRNRKAFGTNFTKDSEISKDFLTPVQARTEEEFKLLFQRYNNYINDFYLKDSYFAPDYPCYLHLFFTLHNSNSANKSLKTRSDFLRKIFSINQSKQKNQSNQKDEIYWFCAIQAKPKDSEYTKIGEMIGVFQSLSELVMWSGLSLVQSEIDRLEASAQQYSGLHI